MKRRIAHFLNYICVVSFVALGPSIARSEDTGWLSFRQSCEAESKPAWVAQTQKGKQWEADSLDNLKRLEEMTQKICPKYFQHPNDTVAIKSFDASKSVILDQSPVVEKQGNELLSFLTQGLVDNQAIFASVEIDFSNTPCGIHMQNTQQRMANRLAEIHDRVMGLAKTCFGVSAQDAAQTLALKGVPKPQGQGAPTRVPTGKGRPQNSDITGLKQEEAKQPR